jgi:transcriptional regulator of nitric oxide reductase
VLHLVGDGTGDLRVQANALANMVAGLQAGGATSVDVVGYSAGGIVIRLKVARGHRRARNLQVRFRDEDYAELADYAEQRGLPVSTVVRLLVLQAITPAGDLKSALDRLESDLAAVRRKALSA